MDNFNTNLREKLLNPVKGWSWQECDAIIYDYFAMLEAALVEYKTVEDILVGNGETP